MLSAKYHVSYWAAALAAAAIYRLLLPLPGVVLACRLALLPLTIYTCRASWQWSFRETKPTDWHLYLHQAAVAHFLVALGSIVNYYRVPYDRDVSIILIHALLGFTAVGTLESFRQNRNDIQPRSLGHYFVSEPRWDLRKMYPTSPKGTISFVRILAAYGVTLLPQMYMVYGILILTDKFLGLKLWGLFPFVWDDKYQIKGRLGSTLVTTFIITPFVDMAETVYYILTWRFIGNRPGWVRKPERLIEERYPPGTHPAPLEIVLSIWCWVPQVMMVCLIQLYEAGSLNLKAVSWLGQWLWSGLDQLPGYL